MRLKVQSMRVRLAASALLAASAIGAAAQRAGTPALAATTLEAATASITPALIRSHVEFFSHDLLEGRDTGQRGFEVAAQYVASQFRRLGLDPSIHHGPSSRRCAWPRSLWGWRSTWPTRL